MAWMLLFAAGVFEVAWAIGLKYAAGFTKLWPSVWTLTTMALSVLFLALSIRTLPLGTAYAVWTGIGTLGVVILGVALFNEPATILRFFFIALIVAGIAGLKITSPQ